MLRHRGPSQGSVDGSGAEAKTAGKLENGDVSASMGGHYLVVTTLATVLLIPQRIVELTLGEGTGKTRR